MMTLLDALNTEQRAAVSQIEGPLLVLAGPGSGKTRVLIHRIAYLMARGVDPWHILAVTFTNRAAREMRERLTDLAGSASQEVTMGTFHALGVRLLRRHSEQLGIARNFLIYDTDDQRAVVKQAIADLNLDDKRFRPNAAHGTISRAKNEGQTPQTFAAQNYREEVSLRIWERYERLMAERNALDFDDLLIRTRQLLSDWPDVLAAYQRRWQYIHVDEFQDTNLVQYDIVRLLGQSHTNLFVVGDIDQSIYGWRGADYRNILKFEESFPQARTIALEQNYRSTQHILDAASALIRHNKERKDKGLWSQLGDGEQIELFEAYDEREEAQYIVREMRRLQSRHGYHNRDMAIMYRTHAQSRALEEQFVRSGLPYTIAGGTRFYERREVKDIMAYLRLLYNPRDGVSFDRILSTPPRGIGARSAERLKEWADQLGLAPMEALDRLAALNAGDEGSALLPDLPSPFDSRSSNALLAFHTLFADWRQEMSTVNLPMLIGTILEDIDYRGYLQGSNDKMIDLEAEERWRNVLELQNVSAQYEELSAEAGLPEFLEATSLMSDADQLPQEEQNVVTMMTLHTAKGLEFPVVFMPGLEENILPHSRSQETKEELEEERRLAYVGITRAKERLYLTYAFRRTVWGSTESAIPSRFLRELPRQTLSKGNAPAASRMGSRADSPSTRTRQGAGSNNADSRWTRTVATSRTKRRPTTTSSASTAFKAGDKVKHGSFGVGTVISAKPSGGDEEVVVAFPDKGTKRLLASFAGLEKV